VRRVATFTHLDDSDARAIAAAFDLGTPIELTPIAAGTINSNFALTTDRGRWFVRVNEGKSPEDVAWEAALCVDLAAAGLPCPVPIAAAGGGRFLEHRGLLVSAFAWRPGRHRAPAEVSLADAAVIGEALARLHVVASARPRGTWREGIYQFSDIVARFEGFRGSTDPALAGAIAVLADELAWLTARAATRAAATHGVIHGDLFRDNVLWDGDALVAILDFEQASRGSLVYDLAVAINDWCWDPARPSPLREDLAAAMIAGYARGRPLDGADRAALPIELRAAAARFTVTRITDVHLRQVDNPDKDFRAFLARLTHWRDRGNESGFPRV
jgi:homoserine kinase type II